MSDDPDFVEGGLVEVARLLGSKGRRSAAFEISLSDARSLTGILRAECGDDAADKWAAMLRELEEIEAP